MAKTTPSADSPLARGLLSHQSGDLEAAAAFYDLALAEASPSPDAWHLRGLLDHQRGLHALAIERIGRAIELSPKAGLYRSNQALALLGAGRVDQAVGSALDGLDLAPGAASRAAFVQTVRHVRFNQADPRAARRLREALEAPWLRPSHLAAPALSLLRASAPVAAMLGSPPEEAWSWADPRVGALADEPLLLAAMESFPLPDRGFEELARRLRRAWIMELPEGAGSDMPGSAKRLRLAMALAIQCELTEWIHAAASEEASRAERLRRSLESALAAGSPVSPWQWGALACFMPLAGLGGAEALGGRKWPAAAKPALDRLWAQPRRVRALAPAIPRAGAMPDPVSQAVRAQYEQNPYPKWSSTFAPPSALGVGAQALADARLPAGAGWAGREQALVAGCGTGLQSCELAMRHPGSDILAIDLSLASLAYAESKARALGLANLRHAQADILQAPGLGRVFHAIECVGVLHHMGDPLGGWRALLSALAPGGVMKVGLYSRAARASIQSARELAARAGAGTDLASLRRWRLELAASADPGIAALARMPDFYCLSEFRDLAMHVQESCFDIPGLASAMRGLGVEFVGFSIGAQAADLWRRAHGSEPDPRSLEGWEHVERLHPQAFLGMYQFHVRKPQA